MREPETDPAARRAPMIQLAPHFALLGGVTAWALVGALSEGPRGVTNPDAALPAALASAALGALVGALATRLYRPRPADEMAFAPELSKLWLVPLFAFFAAVAGAGVAVGLGDTTSGVENATKLGVALSPLAAAWAAWVITRAERASRARRGSLVAAADARSVWSATLALASLVTGAAVVARVAAPVWLDDAAGASTASIGSAWLAAAAALGLVALVPFELRAKRRVAALEREADEGTLAEPDDSVRREGARELLDTGLGDDVLVRVEPGRAAYRDRARATACVRGSVHEATRALAGLRAAHVARVGLALAMLAVHLVTARPVARRTSAAPSLEAQGRLRPAGAMGARAQQRW